jgi:hypothetical protein
MQRVVKRTSARAQKTKGSSYVIKGTPAPLGQGGRFKTLTKAIAKRGARNPAAVAATIGRKKYGTKKMAQMSAAGRKRK